MGALTRRKKLLSRRPSKPFAPQAVLTFVMAHSVAQNAERRTQKEAKNRKKNHNKEKWPQRVLKKWK